MPARLGHRPALDALRGVSVLLVVALHFAGPFRRFIPSAGLGVNVFFVLSGFLITRLLIEEYESTGRIDVRSFMRRRFARLAPALAALLVFVAVGAWGIGVWGDADGVGRGIATTVFYVRNWLTVAGLGEPALGIAWSLAVEEQFYLVWPFVFLAFARRGRLLAGTLVLFGLAAAQTLIRSSFFDVSTETLKYSTDANGLIAVMAGCVLATVLPLEADGRARTGFRAAAVVGAVALLALVLSVDPAGSVLPRGGWALVALATCAVIAGIVAGMPGDWGANERLLRWFGLHSYAIYLWHLPLFALVRHVAPESGPVPQRIAAFVLTVLVSAASMRWIERPARSRILQGGRSQPLDLTQSVDLTTSEPVPTCEQATAERANQQKAA